MYNYFELRNKMFLKVSIVFEILNVLSWKIILYLNNKNASCFDSMMCHRQNSLFLRGGLMLGNLIKISMSLESQHNAFERIIVLCDLLICCNAIGQYFIHTFSVTFYQIWDCVYSLGSLNICFSLQLLHEFRNLLSDYI